MLKQRNLTVNDPDEAVKTLMRINYYRLSAYTLSLKDDGRFKDRVTFRHICLLYEFDKKLRYILLGMLESIEVSFRSHIAYHLAHRYGSMGYRDSSNFAEEKHHRAFLYDLHRSISRNDDLFAQYHRSQYGGQIPIWVVIEAISFGGLSKLFANMKNDDKKCIARNYYRIPYVYLESWLILLSYIRNICAHYGRLYNRLLKFRPRLDRKDKRLGLRTDRIFASVFVINKIYPRPAEWNSQLIVLKALMEEYRDVVELPLIGFPENWATLL